MRYQGKITEWKDDKGFGFITPNGGGPRVFVHVKSFSQHQRRPIGDELVTYELTQDAKGRPQANRVAFVGKPTSPAATTARSNAPVILAVAFLALVWMSALSGKLPVEVAALYLVASLVAFLAYASDKSAARNGRWRTKESPLHLIGLAGGWPGAWAAQRLLRHKSSKRSFQTMFWATVILNCCALAWLFSAPGAEAVHHLLASRG